MFYPENNQKGAAALFLTVILLSGLLVVGLAVGWVMLSEIKLSHGTGDSTVAYYVADSGIEWDLYRVRQIAPPPCPHATENYNVDSGVAKLVCQSTAAGFEIESTGTYRDSARVLTVVQ